jgi:hypothetical protein
LPGVSKNVGRSSIIYLCWKGRAKNYPGFGFRIVSRTKDRVSRKKGRKRSANVSGLNDRGGRDGTPRPDFHFGGDFASMLLNGMGRARSSAIHCKIVPRTLERRFASNHLDHAVARMGPLAGRARRIRGLAIRPSRKLLYDQEDKTHA